MDLGTANTIIISDDMIVVDEPSVVRRHTTISVLCALSVMV